MSNEVYKRIAVVHVSEKDGWAPHTWRACISTTSDDALIEDDIREVTWYCTPKQVIKRTRKLAKRIGASHWEISGILE